MAPDVRGRLADDQAARLALAELEARSVSLAADSPTVAEIIDSYLNRGSASKDDVLEQKKENKSLALQLNQSREELKSTFEAKQDADSKAQQMAREIDRLKSDLRWTEIQLKDRESNLENISKTISWRITTPLRWTLDLFSRK